jgi:hypothetical protein
MKKNAQEVTLKSTLHITLSEGVIMNVAGIVTKFFVIAVLAGNH